MNRRAFEIQFNWIFVLVAGTAILLFFAAVVAKQRSASEISTSATVLKNVQAIIAGASVSSDSVNIIYLPESSIEIGCNRASIGKVSKQYQNLILFAPSLIYGNKLVTQTMGFNAPYKATNILYVTSQQVRYIIIGDTNLAKEIDKSLPAELKKEFYLSVPQIKNTNNYKVRFVVFGADVNGINLANLQKMPDSDVTAIEVYGDGEKGDIKFYQKNADSWRPMGDSVYIGKASLIGAIYSDTIEAYKCNMQNVFSRLNLVSKIYSKKAESLRNSVVDVSCRNPYSSALVHLSQISGLSQSFEDSDISIIGIADSLENNNKDLQKNSCPLIY